MYRISFTCVCKAIHELEVYGDTEIECGCGKKVSYIFDPKIDEYVIKEDKDVDGNC